MSQANSKESLLSTPVKEKSSTSVPQPNKTTEAITPPKLSAAEATAEIERILSEPMPVLRTKEEIEQAIDNERLARWAFKSHRDHCVKKCEKLIARGAELTDEEKEELHKAYFEMKRAQESWREYVSFSKMYIF